MLSPWMMDDSHPLPECTCISDAQQVLEPLQRLYREFKRRREHRQQQRR